MYYKNDVKLIYSYMYLNKKYIAYIYVDSMIHI